MSIGMVSIAFVPGYATIGLLAPLLVLAGRLLQGFSAGMELGGVSVYLSEIASPGHKGFYVSWQSASQQAAVMFAALLGVVLNGVLPPAAMAAWGWRVPLFIGCAIIPFPQARLSLGTDDFLARAAPRLGDSRSLAPTGKSWAWNLMVTVATMSFYDPAFTPTFSSTIAIWRASTA
jgi:MFS family permease